MRNVWQLKVTQFSGKQLLDIFNYLLKYETAVNKLLQCLVIVCSTLVHYILHCKQMFSDITQCCYPYRNKVVTIFVYLYYNI